MFDHRRYATLTIGVIVAGLASSTVSILLGLMNRNTFSDEYVKSLVLSSLSFTTIILSIALFVKRYWLTISVVMFILFVWSVYSVVYLVPIVGGDSWLVHLWRCRSMLFDQSLNILVLSYVFNRYRIQSRITLG